MKAKVFLLALFIMNVFQMSAQNSDEVTLVVSAVGATTEDATKTALRSAIEQAYGAFVSANTTILNDELVKDEIVTISSGNIKEYKEISRVDLPDGRLYVTLQATVSISKLISYAQSKGAETEFAGATFGANLAMYELNKKNEEIAFENMKNQLDLMTNLFDYELKLEEPIIREGECIIYGKVYLIYNNNTDVFNEIYMTTLSSLSIPEEEREKMDAMGLNERKGYFSHWPPYMPGSEAVPKNRITIYDIGSFYLRNDYYNKYKGYGRHIRSSYWWLMDKHITDFVIADNLSSPTNLNVILDSWDAEYYNYEKRGNYKERGEKYNKFYSLKKEIKIDKYKTTNEAPLFPYYKEITLKKFDMIGEKVGYVNIEIRIPIADVSKYNKFEVKPKTK